MQVLNNVDPGLVVAGVPDADAFNVNLGAAPQSFDMFDIFTNEGSIEWDDLTNPKDGRADVQLHRAEVKTTARSTSAVRRFGYSIFGVIQGGKLTWNNGGVGTFQLGRRQPELLAAEQDDHLGQRRHLQRRLVRHRS